MPEKKVEKKPVGIKGKDVAVAGALAGGAALAAYLLMRGGITPPEMLTIDEAKFLPLVPGVELTINSASFLGLVPGVELTVDRAEFLSYYTGTLTADSAEFIVTPLPQGSLTTNSAEFVTTGPMVYLTFKSVIFSKT